MIVRGRAGAFSGLENDYRRGTAPAGSVELFREAVPEDADRLRRMFARCSRETIYLRFHASWPTVPE